MFYIFERLGHMHENKIFFLFFLYFIWQHFGEIEYFNTRFVSLHYKNTNQY
jgi:hypothetical protein